MGADKEWHAAGLWHWPVVFSFYTSSSSFTLMSSSNLSLHGLITSPPLPFPFTPSPHFLRLKIMLLLFPLWPDPFSSISPPRLYLRLQIILPPLLPWPLLSLPHRIPFILKSCFSLSLYGLSYLSTTPLSSPYNHAPNFSSMARSLLLPYLSSPCQVSQIRTLTSGRVTSGAS